MKSEFLFSFLLIVLLVLFLKPFGFFMPPPIIMLITLALIIVFALFAILAWREQTKDERENLHKLIAARFAYLAGAAILVTGIVAQAFQHNIDSWLVTALIVMILGKIIGFLYGQKKY